MNKVILIGNLTKDPEITTTSNGVSVGKFTLAVQRKFRNESGEYEADFLNIVVWRELAELSHKYLAKGKKVAVVGRIQTRSYDAADGTKRYLTEIVADEVEFISARSSDGEGAKKEESDVAKLEPVDDNDLPF